MDWSTAKYWYRKFRNDNFDLPDSPRTDRLFIFDENRLIDLLRTDNWYRKFRNDNFDLPDSPRTDRLFIFDENRLIDLLRTDNRQTCRELAVKMNSVVRAIPRLFTSMVSEQKFRV
uniref:HTH_48 domain-containing protein n=1 Tax=Strongyloides papillosus TaxID=174720 RepID=A0A0N5C527_STREA